MSDRLAAALVELVAALREELGADGMPARPAAYSVEQAAELAGVGRTFLYREVAAGRLRVVRRGRRVLVPASALAAYVEGAA